MNNLNDFLRHFGNPLALGLMGSSIASWLADHGMAVLSAIGIATSIMIQILTYRLRREVANMQLKSQEGKSST